MQNVKCELPMKIALLPLFSFHSLLILCQSISRNRVNSQKSNEQDFNVATQAPISNWLRFANEQKKNMPDSHDFFLKILFTV